MDSPPRSSGRRDRPSAGDLVDGRFEIEHEAGSGGMGTVYRARDRFEGTAVALKVLHDDEAGAPERFEREAAILSELRHSAIVSHVAHGTVGTGTHYLAMDWLDGEDLAARLARKGLTIDESVTLACRAAGALGYAHERGLVHRDVKPSNLFLPGGDVARAKLLDFGIARRERSARRVTSTGLLVGTPGYMAPEQVKGASVVDARADVFSLGCVFFECLTGRPAFGGHDMMAMFAKLLVMDAPRLREVLPGAPAELDELLARMLAKAPEERPRNGHDVLEELERIELDAAWKTSMEEMSEAGLRDSPPATLRGGAPSITSAEQRIVCIVLAGAPTGDRALSLDEGSWDLAELRQLVDEYAGRLERMADGSFIATLSGSGNAVDHASRAARCALAMRARFADIPIVLAMGRVTLSPRSVVGEVIDRGARALRATPNGMIRLDDITAGALGARFELERVGDADFLRGERATDDVVRLLLGKPIAFVGRTREMAMLEAGFAGCISEPASTAILVTAPPGAGKSRLRQEFLAAILGSGAAVEVLFGAGDSLVAGSPFAMLAGALRREAKIRDGQAPEVQRRRLVDRVGRHVREPQLARTAAFLGELAGVPFPDEADDALRAARRNAMLMSDGIGAAWEDWIAAECAAGPLVLVLEDLHWGDAATVRLVDAALRNLRGAPFMVLALARPEVTTRFPSLWAERDVQTMRLGPIQRKSAERLVRDALGEDVPEPLLARIVDQANGNAFYLEELIRAVAAGRTDSFPTSVLGVVEARLHEVGPEARRILRAASIFGERFSRDGVAALLGGDRHRDSAEEWLQTLATRELVARVPGPRTVTESSSVPPDGEAEYAFRHALVRQAAYAMLTDEDRALGHRLAGEWLEQIGHPDAMVLAEHFDRGGAPTSAVPWFRRAAEQALDANDLTAAIERAERGIACGANGCTLGALRLVQAEAHVWRGELALAEERGLAATGLLERGSAAWFRAASQGAVASAKQGGFDQLESWSEQASATDPDPGPDAQVARLICLNLCATYLIFGGRYAYAGALIEMMDAEAEAEAGGPSQIDPEATALGCQTRAIQASFAGDLGKCLRGFEAALAAFDQAGDGRNACAVRANLGFIFAELGDYASAEDALASARATALRMGLYDVASVALHNLGHVVANFGRLEEARAIEMGAIESFSKQGDPRMEGVARSYLAKIALLSNDLETAEREARLAIEMLEVAPPLRASAVGTLARVLLAAGRTDEGLAAAREAMSELEALGTMEEGEALVRLVYAEALAAAGEAEEASRAIGAARDHLLGRAAKISDEALRERFLSAVSDNWTTIHLARSWLDGEGGDDDDGDRDTAV